MKNIPVTQPYLPSLAELYPYLEEIWHNKWLTNNGPMHQKLEYELCNFLGVEHISLFNNATIALMAALKAFDLKGDIITTPYSFIATTQAAEWNNLKPIFVDIEKDGYNIDVAEVEKAIDKNTCAILPVHCYGHPCDVEGIKKLADKHNVKVIYDAAHAFASKLNGKSLLDFGDASVVSFHATKVFNTFEGGAVISKSREIKEKIDAIKNFGLNKDNDVDLVGLNGKMSEVNAAFGLVQLNHIERNIERRKKICELYESYLNKISGISYIHPSKELENNYSYFPILIEKNFRCSRDELFETLIKHGIVARKYFNPLISNMSLYKNKNGNNRYSLDVANDRSDKVLCLPLYADLSNEQVKKIVDIIKG